MSSHDLTSVASDATIQESGETNRGVLPGVRSAKIRDRHLDQQAVVYVRQSSPQQVLHHRESRERQYALVDRAALLGWARDRIVLIDEDQGRSAKTSDDRSGFHRILSEVTMGHVGLVLGIEMARLARSNKDWHQLLGVVCGLRHRSRRRGRDL